MHRLFFLLILTLPLFHSFSMVNAQNFETKSFKNTVYYTTNDGLSQNEVTSIIKDRKGFLWVGTRGGLNRFDGSGFKVFNPKLGDKNSLVSGSVETLYEDSQGIIWIGTKTNGISRYDPVLDLFVDYHQIIRESNSFVGTRVISIVEGNPNEIWAGTWANGISIIDINNNRVSHILSGVRVESLIALEDGTIWAGTFDGLYHFAYSGEQIGHYKPDEPTNGGSIDFNSVRYDNQLNLLYIASWSKYLFVFDLNTKTFETKLIFENSTEQSGMNGYFLYPNEDGRIWIGSWGHGLKSYNPNDDLTTFYDLGIPSKGGKEPYKSIISIYKDNLGILWLGTNGGGLCKIDEGFDRYNIKNPINIPSEPIWSILNDQSNETWIGFRSMGKLYQSYNGLNYSSVTIEDFNSSLIYGFKTIYEDLDNNIWTATNRALYKIRSNASGYSATPVNVVDRTGQKANIVKVTALHQTMDSIFWIGTQQKGLFRTIKGGDPSSQPVKQYPQHLANGLKNDRITAFLEDNSGDFWVGTYGGLLLYNKSTDDFVEFSQDLRNVESISSNIIICLYEDSKNRLWVGTPSGLNLKKVSKDGTISFRVYGIQDGLPNNYIHSILEDDLSNLWISTNKGIAKFNVEKNIFTTYDVTDGLKSNSFMENAAAKDKHGNFYFGGIYGLNIFHPDSIKRGTLPKVVFTSLKIQDQEIRANQSYNDEIVLNKSIAYADTINLRHNQNTFSIFFTVMNFKGKSQYTFRYKLEGAETEWHTGIGLNNLTYSNLSPGRYRLIIKVINDDGQSNPENEAVLDMLIKPPFWATWQAYLLYLFCSALTLWLIFYTIHQRNKLKTRLEVARIERMNQVELAELKTNFFTNITHEFRTPLSLILGPVERLINQDLGPEDRKSLLITVHYHTKRLLRLVQQLLDFRKSEEGKIQLKVAEGNFMKFAEEIFISFKERAKARDISFTFESTSDELILTYDRDKMEIVICNLLINAFNYSKAGESVSLSVSKIIERRKKGFPGYCQIKVSDSGQGMTDDQLDKIFDRFYQIVNTNSANIVGSGIGLYLVKQIVDLHHGKVKVKSKENAGSVFTILLPLGQAHFHESQFLKEFKRSEDYSHYDINLFPSPIPVKKQFDRNGHEKSKLHKLLVVDDNAEIRNFITSIFKNEYKIIQAENGQEALNMAQKSIPDLIISDLMMPELNGIELCRELRQCPKTVQIPFILLTARTAVVHEEEGYNSGVDVFVTKPFHPNVLIAQVNALITKRERLKTYFGKVITLNLSESDAISEEEHFLNKVILFIENNLGNENLNRDLISSELAMSPSTFYRKIKISTNLGVNAFIRAIRLKKAAQMLENKEGNVGEIAYSVGFQDLKYFRECFKKQFGENPSDYLKSRTT